jgi:hypothetical protein
MRPARANPERQPGVPTYRITEINPGVQGHIVAPPRSRNHAHTRGSSPRQIWRSVLAGSPPDIGLGRAQGRRWVTAEQPGEESEPLHIDAA